MFPSTFPLGRGAAFWIDRVLETGRVPLLKCGCLLFPSTLLLDVWVVSRCCDEPDCAVVVSRGRIGFVWAKPCRAGFLAAGVQYWIGNPVLAVVRQVRRVVVRLRPVDVQPRSVCGLLFGSFSGICCSGAEVLCVSELVISVLKVERVCSAWLTSSIAIWTI